jgi:hypothetical protein
MLDLEVGAGIRYGLMMTATGSALFAALLVLVIAPSAAAHDKGDENKPPPPVSMRIIAPSAKGPWLLRIDNEGDQALFIGADVRLLSFEVSAPLPPKKLGRGKTWQTAAKCDGPKAFGLDDHFPAGRELVLEPGQSYVEEFDPRLICFGKNADLLVPGTRVKPYFGWQPRPKWRRGMETAPFVADAATRPRKYRPLRRLEAPTVLLSYAPPAVYGPEAPPPKAKPGRVDERSSKKSPKGAQGERSKSAKASTPTKDARGDGGYGPRGTRDYEDPARPEDEREATAKDRGMAGAPQAESKEAPSKATSRDAEQASEHRPRPIVPTPKKKPPPEDALAARLALTASHYSDSARPTDISLSVQAHNVGQRPLFVALRGRMLSFHVEGPDGPVECSRATTEHKVPRDLFRLMHHGTHIHMEVMLGEVCPAGTFDRPGLYLAIPTLHANAEGKEYGLSAATGVATTRGAGHVSGTHDPRDDATLIRIRDGRRPFYGDGPQQLPTRVLPGGAAKTPTESEKAPADAQPEKKPAETKR